MLTTKACEVSAPGVSTLLQLNRLTGFLLCAVSGRSCSRPVVSIAVNTCKRPKALVLSYGLQCIALQRPEVSGKDQAAEDFQQEQLAE